MPETHSIGAEIPPRDRVGRWVAGATLNGRYLLEELIATGGMGEVWRGVDPSLQRRVAVKVLLPSLVADAAFITRFRIEAQTMAALRHPGIVQVYDYGQHVLPDGGTLDYLVMEFIDGIPLSTAVRQAGTLDARQTLEIVAQAAEALQAAHEAGIVHRDVKPSNLLIRPGSSVVLVDFGLARSSTATGITGTNVVMGTAHYMAPEQAEGRPVTPATDVYAVGASAYYCLTGRTPYVGDGPLEILGQLVYGPPPSLPPGVPPEPAAVVMRAMDKDPARRYPNAAALAQAARSALEGAGSTGSTRAPTALAAFLGHDIPGATTGGHTTALATTRVDDRIGTGGPTPARAGRKPWWLSAVGALVVFVVAVVAWLRVLDGGSVPARASTATVPNLQGLPLADAVKQLTAVGLVQGKVQYRQNPAQAGKVLAQSATLASVPARSAVDLVIGVSLSAPKIASPDSGDRFSRGSSVDVRWNQREPWVTRWHVTTQKQNCYYYFLHSYQDCRDDGQADTTVGIKLYTASFSMEYQSLLSLGNFNTGSVQAIVAALDDFGTAGPAATVQFHIG